MHHYSRYCHPSKSGFPPFLLMCTASDTAWSIIKLKMALELFTCQLPFVGEMKRIEEQQKQMFIKKKS